MLVNQGDKTCLAVLDHCIDFIVILFSCPIRGLTEGMIFVITHSILKNTGTGLRVDATRVTSLFTCDLAFCLLGASLDRLVEARDGFFSVCSRFLISFNGRISPGVSNR